MILAGAWTIRHLRWKAWRSVPHKKYLNDYFQGYAGDSDSRGELYNADPVTGDARFCGTTASMCGVEKAGFEQDDRCDGCVRSGRI